MTNVIIRENETFERALRRFTKSCEKSGILADVKRHQHFEKPSERRKRKLAAARRKNRRREEY
jgi:small subunit ribosomal protein S21